MSTPTSTCPNHDATGAGYCPRCGVSVGGHRQPWRATVWMAMAFAIVAVLTFGLSVWGQTPGWRGMAFHVRSGPPDPNDALSKPELCRKLAEHAVRTGGIHVMGETSFVRDCLNRREELIRCRLGKRRGDEIRALRQPVNLSRTRGPALGKMDR